jgi:hypothetical protein
MIMVDNLKKQGFMYLQITAQPIYVRAWSNDIFDSSFPLDNTPELLCTNYHIRSSEYDV